MSASTISPRATGVRPSTPSSPDADDGQPAARCGSVGGERASERHAEIYSAARAEHAIGGTPREPTRPKVVLSLAGRTARPAAQPVPVRSRRLRRHRGAGGLSRRAATQVLIDATHPYAATIATAHPAEAAMRAGALPSSPCDRRPGRPVAPLTGGRSKGVDAAIGVFGDAPRRVFLLSAVRRSAPSPPLRNPRLPHPQRRSGRTALNVPHATTS